MEWILILIRKIIKIEYHFRIRNEATRRSYAYVFFFLNCTLFALVVRF